MTGSRNSSSPLPSLRLELRPSRWLALTLGVLGALAAASVLMSELQPPSSWAAAAFALVAGSGYSRRSLREPTRVIVLRGDGQAEVDGFRVCDFAASFQGPLTQLQWRCGAHSHRIVSWPDVLNASTRRELRLWALMHRASARAPAVAG